MAAVAALVWSAISLGSPLPPRSLVLATGPEGSAYREFGSRYAEVLRRRGIAVELVGTGGGADNLARLRDAQSDVNVAFVELGLATREQAPDVISLGTVCIQPLWFFLRASTEGAVGTVAERLAGRRISIGPEGSGDRVLALRFLALNAVDENSAALPGLTPAQSVRALSQGEIDGAVMLAEWNSPAVRKLLVADGIELMAYPRADAYIALFPYLSKVVLPTGVADLARNIPSADVPMLAVETSLAVRTGLHPALQYMLLEAAAEIHGGRDIFHAAGRFPAAEAVELPLSPKAREFHRSGQPFVYRHLPFWLAGVAERLLILLIPLFAVALPIAQFVPAMVAYVIQRRIFGLYGELKVLELELERAGPDVATDDIATALEDLARRASHLRVPLGYAQRLFILKSHIGMALQGVAKRRRAEAGDGPV